MNRAIAAVAITCASVFIFTSLPAKAAPADAPNPETLAAAKKLLATMKVKESMEPVLTGMRKMQDAMIDKQQLTPEQKTAAREVMKASMGEIEKVLSWDSIGTLMARVYAKVFTTEEVNDLITLFESPAGQVFVKKQVELQMATMQEMQKIMVDLMPKIQEQTKAAIERAKAQEQKN